MYVYICIQYTAQNTNQMLKATAQASNREAACDLAESYVTWPLLTGKYLGERNSSGNLHCSNLFDKHCDTKNQGDALQIEVNGKKSRRLLWHAFQAPAGRGGGGKEAWPQPRQPQRPQERPLRRPGRPDCPCLSGLSHGLRIREGGKAGHRQKNRDQTDGAIPRLKSGSWILTIIYYCYSLCISFEPGQKSANSLADFFLPRTFLTQYATLSLRILGSIWNVGGPLRSAWHKA